MRLGYNQTLIKIALFYTSKPTNGVKFILCMKTMLRMEIYRTIATKNSLNEKVKGHILGTF